MLVSIEAAIWNYVMQSTPIISTVSNSMDNYSTSDKINKIKQMTQNSQKGPDG